MKKMLLVAAVASFTLASCKKEYTCECTTKVNGQVTGTSSVTIKETKKKAEDACSATASSSGGGVSATVECQIK